MRRPITLVPILLATSVAAAALPGCTQDRPTTAGTTTTTVAAPPLVPIVFNGTGNNLDAYAAMPDADGEFAVQRVDKTAADDPAEGRDINGQICFFPQDGTGTRRFIAGEDTNQPDPPPGWGIFELTGDRVGSLSAKQVAKLTPTYQPSDDNPENYGCGFLSDGRILTTDVGGQATGDGTGQLIVWFGPFDGNDVKYCKIDTSLATAQSILVGPDDAVYVAASRGAVYRYAPPFPSGPDAAGGCGALDSTGAPTATAVSRSVFIAAGENDLATPAGLAPAPDGGMYVSSVFNGVINRYDADGSFVGPILRPPAGETLGEKPYSTGTPLGIGTAPDGSLFYADIGVVITTTVGPGRGTGSVRRIAFVDGEPQPPETLAAGLQFPDGIGILDPSTP